MTERLRIGDMLVATGLVTEAQVQEALSRQKEMGLRLGETLVALGYVTEGQMTQVVSSQLTVPWVNLYHVDFSRELLELIPAEVAEEYCLVPVYVRHVRRQGNTLYVAMDNPLNNHALQAAADGSGLPVRPMVASPTDIKNAIRVYYLGLPPLSEASAVQSMPPEHLDEDDLVSEPTPEPVPAPEPASEPEPEAEPEPEERPPVRPSIPPGNRPNLGFLTLTLLDGTQVRLPSPGGPKKKQKVDRGLTTRDLIHALQAKAAGEDVGDILPDNAWEPLFATLLSVLLRKGLLADWEFVDEWNKQKRKAQDESG